MIILTEAAQNEVRRLMDEQNVPNLLLRVGVVGGGCSGLSYSMNFDTEVDDADQVFEQGPVRVVIDPRSFAHLDGTTVDYVTNLMGSGFKFTNPNANHSCGCGTSFSV